MMNNTTNNEKSMSVFTIILGIISGMSTLLLLLTLFFNGDKIKVDIVNTYQGYFGEYFDFANYVPRVVMICMILTFVLIIIKTANPIVMILYNATIIPALTFLGQQLNKYQFSEGIIYTNDFFNIRRIISLDEKKQWLMDKIARYSPGSEYEPSRQWLINNTSDINYDSVEQLNFKIQQKIAEYVAFQQKSELLKLKTNKAPQKGVFDYVENFAGWVMDHPKTMFFVVAFCAGLYFYNQVSLEEKVKKLFEQQNSVNDETKSFMEITKTAITKLDQNSKNILEQTQEFARLVWKKVEELISSQNEIIDNNKITQHIIKSVSNTLVDKTEELQDRINSMQTDFTSNLAKHAANEMKTSNIFQKVDNFNELGVNLEKKLSILETQISGLQIDYSSLSTKLLSEILVKMPDNMSRAISSPAITEILKTQCELAAQEWCSKNIQIIYDSMNANQSTITQDLSERITVLAQSVRILAQAVATMQQPAPLNTLLEF